MRQAFLVALLLMLMGATPNARAQNCASITDRGCPVPPAITVARNLRVEIRTRQHEFSYPLPDGEEGADMAYACPEGKCPCSESIQYIEFKGPVPAFREVNAREYKAAASQRCSIDSYILSRDIARFSVTKRTISIATDELDYCRTCGGGCHGHTALTSYDAKTGKILTLRDAVPMRDLDALRARILDAFVTANFYEERRAERRQFLSDDLAALGRLKGQDGLYVERGRVFLNLDTFALGCADGSFYPVEIPHEFLTPDFRARL